MHDTNVKANILSKVLCTDVGLRLRSRFHCTCHWTTETWKMIARCGGKRSGVEMQPCCMCGVNTCDECRIHVVYHVFSESPGLDGHPWWAGYPVLIQHATAIYPPKRGDTSEWDLPSDQAMPLHDQGRVHSSLYDCTVGEPEPIDRLLDFNLGQGDIPQPAGTLFLAWQRRWYSTFVLRHNTASSWRVHHASKKFGENKFRIAPVR